MVIPFMTIYATQELGFTIQQAGIIMALFGAGSIAGSFIGGRITDKFGFYGLQLAALFSGGLMFIVLGYLKTFPLLCIGTVVLSICNESFRPGNSAAIAHYSEVENRTRSYALNRLAINLGFAVGGALGGFFAAKNYHLLFWIDGLTNISAAFLLMALLPKARTTAKADIKEETQGTSAYRDKPYLLFILITILFASCFFQMFGMQPVFFKTEWKLTEQFIGVLMAINGLLIALVEMVAIYKLENKKSSIYYIRRGVLLIGLGFMLLSLLPPSQAVAIISMVLITIGEMLSMPFMNTFWISRTSINNRGQYAGLYSMAWSVAQIIAPIAGSAIIQQYGFYMLWYAVALTCVIVVFMSGPLSTKAPVPTPA